MRSEHRLQRPHQHQRGVAALLVVMVLFFVISLVAAYTSRNLIFEQRTASNQLRSTQALEVAEAGIEWTLSMLNHSRIDANCEASTSVTDTSFRQRYLTFDASGRITPTPKPGGGELNVMCVATTTGWGCSCPTATNPSVTAPNAPAFRVRFLQMQLRDALNTALSRQPGFFRIQVVACTRYLGSTDPCLDFSGNGEFAEGRAMLWHNLALTGSSTSPPQVALLARGNVAVTGSGFSAYNTQPNGSGFTVQAGGTVSGAPTLAGAPGSPGGTATTIQTDSALQSGPSASQPLAPIPALGAVPGISTQDRMFAALFNMRPDTFRTQQGAIELTCPLSGCVASDVRDAASLNPGRPIWVGGNLIVDTAGDIGSAMEPVLLVVAGDLQATVSGVNIFGMVYVRKASWATGTAALQITGAAVAEGDVSGVGPVTFVFDPDVMRRLRWTTGTFVRVPGSWKDFIQL